MTTETLTPDTQTSERVGPSRWNPIAIAALLVSVLPVVSVAAPVLGLVALLRLRSRPHERGRALAWAAIVIGLTTSAAQAGLGWLMAEVHRATVERPAEALRAAWSGDAEAFRERMAGPGHEATSDRVAAWVAPLRASLGEFEALEPDFGRAVPEPTVPVPEREMSGLFKARFRGAAGTTSVPATVVYERPLAGEAPTSVRVRRYEFEMPDGTRIVWPEDGPRERPNAERREEPAR